MSAGGSAFHGSGVFAAMLTLRSKELLNELGRCPSGPTTWFYEHLVPKTGPENLAFRRLLWELSRDPEIQQDLITVCGRDILFYINVFGVTLSPKDHPRCPVQPFITWPFQDRALLEMQSVIGIRDVANPKSRDVGASWCSLLPLEHFWHFDTMQQFLLTSQVEELVDGKSEKALFRKLDFWWSWLPAWLKPTIIRNAKSAFNKDTGSRINGQATVPNLARGDRPTSILLDEAAEMSFAGEIASSTRDATNCRIYNSTPNGRFGTGKQFYEVCRNPSVKKIWMHWSEVPTKAAGLYKLKRKVTKPGKTEFVKGEWIGERDIAKARKDGKLLQVSELQRLELDWRFYRWQDDYDFDRLQFRDGEKPRSEWYDLQCAREPNLKRIAKELDLDFSGSTEKLSSGVDMETLRIVMCRKPLYTGEVLPSEESFQEGLQHLRPVWLAGSGFLEIWCDLPDGKPPLSTYSIGIDISGGTGGTFTSQSVMSVWDNISGEQVAEWRSSTLSPDDLAIRAVCLAKWFHNAKLIPEINGPVGTRFKNKMVECEYWNCYRRSQSDLEAFETPTSKLGWFSTKGPEVLLRGLLAAFTTGEAKPRSVVLLEQIEEYEWSNGQVIHKSSASNDSQADKGKQHGDAAVGAGLGWLGVETAKQLAINIKAKSAPDEDVYPEGTLGYRRQQRERERERNVGDVVESVW